MKAKRRCTLSLVSRSRDLRSVYDQYIQDAQQAGDQELAEFFENLKQASSSTAEKAKQLLSQRLQQS